MTPHTLARAALLGLLLAPAAFAHAPVFDCFIEGDKLTCEGGFSDGSSATGVAVKVLDKSDKLLLQGKIGADGRVSFPKPTGDYHVFFDAGAGHSMTVFSADIT